jgi:hypothetical protein
MSDQSVEKLPDSYYVDKHQNEDDGVDQEDVTELAQLFGAVRGELGQVDKHREGLTSGPPISKLGPSDIKNVLRGHGKQSPISPNSGQSSNFPERRSTAPEKPSIVKPIPSTPPVVTSTISQDKYDSVEKRVTALEKQYQRVFQPVELTEKYTVTGDDIQGNCSTFEELFDLLKRCIKLECNTISIHKTDENKHK